MEAPEFQGQPLGFLVRNRRTMDRFIFLCNFSPRICCWSVKKVNLVVVQMIVDILSTLNLTPPMVGISFGAMGFILEGGLCGTTRWFDSWDAIETEQRWREDLSIILLVHITWANYIRFIPARNNHSSQHSTNGNPDWTILFLPEYCRLNFYSSEQNCGKHVLSYPSLSFGFPRTLLQWRKFP